MAPWYSHLGTFAETSIRCLGIANAEQKPDVLQSSRLRRIFQMLLRMYFVDDIEDAAQLRTH